MDKCRTSEGYLWQRSNAQGVARLTKEVTESIESWIMELVPAKPTKKAEKVDLIKGRVSYSRKGNNLALNLKMVDDSMVEEILAFVESKLK